MTELISNSLATVKRQLAACAEDPVWQRTWLEIECASWRTLAVVPADDRSSLDVVHGLAAVAWQQQGNPIVVADLRTIGLPGLAAVRGELRRRIDNGERVLIATQCLSKSPAATTIVRDVDVAVLCVEMGRTMSRSVVDTVKEIGRKRILGTITLQVDGRVGR